MKVALVHDWLIRMRGGEKVLENIAELYPEATIYTLFFDKSQLSPTLQKRNIRASFLQFIPGIRYFYRWLLPLFPSAIESLKIEEDVDVVISSSHCVAKGIRIPKNAVHFCYCHTPMRYVWGFEELYFGNYPKWIQAVIYKLLPRLKSWDIKSSDNVHFFIANSENVKNRIENFYHRQSEVIFPPFDNTCFKSEGKKSDYYLIVSALVPYKRADLVVEAFNVLDRKLIVVGSGPQESKCRQLAKSKNITFYSAPSSKELQRLYSSARALIFPTDEDFGIVPLEAQACGTPVIAYRKGGALETVKSGVFFDEQTPEAIQKAVLYLETLTFDPQKIAFEVQNFSPQNFKKRLQSYIHNCTQKKKENVCC